MVLKGMYSINWNVLCQGLSVVFCRRQREVAHPQAVFECIFSTVNKTFLKYELLEPRRKVRQEMLIKTKSDVRRQEPTSLLCVISKTREILLPGVVD
jgi:hypothetical protein